MAENIDNDAFTNAAAKANLQYATAAAKILGIKADPDWQEVAQNIPVLKFPDGVTKEFATYTGQGIKQAVVNLLVYPLKTITDPMQIKKDLEYYEIRVPNEGTPAMTQGIFTLLYSRLGDGEKSTTFLRMHTSQICCRHSQLLLKPRAVQILILQQGRVE